MTRENILWTQDDMIPITHGEPGGDLHHESRRPRLPMNLPLLPVKDLSLFPRMVLPMLISDQKNQRLVDHVLAGDRVVGLAALKDPEHDQVHGLDELHTTGVAALVIKMNRTDEGETRLVAQGLCRFRILELVSSQPFLVARVEQLDEVVTDDLESMALLSNIRGLFRQVVEKSPHLPAELLGVATGVDHPGALCDLVAGVLNISPAERQAVVEAIDISERLKLVSEYLNRELRILELGSQIQDKVKKGLDESQRQYYLRQQLKAIQSELGDEAGGEESEAAEYERRLAEKKLPEAVRTEAQRELDRMAGMNSSSSEYHVITTYLDWILDLPWLESTPDHLDIKEARRILAADHHGLEKVKRRILEYLAVRQLNPGLKGPILCLVGPPGVGKTSLGKSIARSLGRKFIRLSLGGVRDEAEIRGHRRTYVGALPGRVIQGLKRAGANNPVFMLDEIDKVGADFRGDPASALLEVLDPEQNFEFSDHYLDLPMDLSKVMFVTTANVLDTIPAPLRDRMEVIEIPGYTAEEKLTIAKRYLVPRQREQHGLKANQAKVTDGALKLLISGYTREAGVRNLEREIGSLFRWAARSIAEGEAETVTLGNEQVAEILGPRRITPEAKMRTAVPGVATGLAWTPAGGDILFIEATSMPGKGALILTGQLGDVMKESAQAAVSYVRAHAADLGVDPRFHQELDLHLHVPAGAIPKDGPSAGVTLFTALVSLLTGKTVRSDLAMTGEITLRGLVLPVGGIKEKVLAARRAGIKHIILPAQCEKDLWEVPDEAKKELNFLFAERVDQVVGWAFSPQPPCQENPQGGCKPRPRKRRPKQAPPQPREQSASA